MADKNKNGIDDKYETYKPGQKIASPAGIPGTRAKEVAPNNWLTDMVTRPLRQGANFLGDLALGFSGQGGRSEQDRIGTGLGDSIFGVTPGYYDERNRAVEALAARSPSPAGLLRSAPQAGGGPITSEKGLLEYLAEAGGLVDQLGIGGGGGAAGVDYSGAMSAAQGQAAANRVNLGAVYNQLRQGLVGDRSGIEENYGGAIDRSQEIAQNAQDVTRDAYAAAAANQNQAASALGMQNAAASQQLDRPTTEQLAADAISDSAAYAQNAQQQYNSQQANALTHNTNVQGASRFAEARGIAELDQSLQDRIASLAQLQAESASQASMANAAAGGSRGSAILSLAQQLYGDAQAGSQQDFENQLAAAKIANSQQQTSPTYTLSQLMQGQEESGLNLQDYLSYMKLLSSMNR